MVQLRLQRPAGELQRNCGRSCCATASTIYRAIPTRKSSSTNSASYSRNRRDWIPPDCFGRLAARFDGAYSLVLINALGEMILARDPLGMKPLSYACDDSLFAAASESVALANLGFDPAAIRPVPPGHVIVVDADGWRCVRFASSPNTAHCFFEWVYFANVASSMDGRSVYEARRALGEELAEQELSEGVVPLDEETIVVPVPDTSKAAADAMAYRLRVPCREGLIRNRYLGRTFIQSDRARQTTALSKYTPLREVLEGKRIVLVEDSIVRSTTMRVLLHRLREEGAAREIHVRVACPPIIAPCFYGIDMSTVGELFAARYAIDGSVSLEAQNAMAEELGADSLRYLPQASVARAIGMHHDQLCRGCITGRYPTPQGQALYEIAQHPASQQPPRDARTNWHVGRARNPQSAWLAVSRDSGCPASARAHMSMITPSISRKRAYRSRTLSADANSGSTVTATWRPPLVSRTSVERSAGPHSSSTAVTTSATNPGRLWPMTLTMTSAGKSCD